MVLDLLRLESALNTCTGPYDNEKNPSMYYLANEEFCKSFSVTVYDDDCQGIVRNVKKIFSGLQWDFVVRRKQLSSCTIISVLILP